MHLSEQRPRPATRDDIDSIVRLVGEMYADLAEEHTGERPTVRPDWAPLAAEALADRLGIDVMAFVVELPPTGVVAVAVGRLHETLPSPRRATTTAGYLEWVRHRRRRSTPRLRPSGGHVAPGLVRRARGGRRRRALQRLRRGAVPGVGLRGRRPRRSEPAPGAGTLLTFRVGAGSEPPGPRIRPPP